MKQQKRSQSASPAVENLKKDSNSCPNCGQSFFSHNDDGSCVEDSNMEDLRTKGEWEAITWGRLIVACGKYFITDAPKIVICDMNQNLPEAEANAAYIVESVNNFENLKAENTKLAASNLELLGIVKQIESFYDLENGRLSYHGDGDQLVIDMQTAINNSKGATE